MATVSEQLTDVTSITRTNGKPSLGISVTATPDGNAVAISNEIKDLLPQLQTDLGSGAVLTPIFDQAPFVQKSIEGLTTEGLLGLVMAVLVILFFLLSIRSTLVTAVSIPLSVIVALIALRVFDYSLNVLTLGALTIAIGRVVDDSIVVLENIKRHLGYGEERREAILTAVKEVAGAVTASTLTTVAVFSPIALVGGLVGQLFAPFAITVTVALLASLLVSLTVIPVLAYWFLKPAQGSVGGRGPARGRGEGAAQPAAAGLPAGHRLGHPPALAHRRAGRGGLPRHHRPGPGAADQLLRPVRPDHADRSARRCRWAPASPPPTRRPKKVEAVLAATAGREDLPGHPRHRRRPVRHRRRPATTRPCSRSPWPTTPRCSPLQDTLRSKLGAPRPGPAS